jgi:hypothetical protein
MSCSHGSVTKILLRPFTLGIDKPPPKSFQWTCTQWYFIVALSFLPQDKPPLVIGVGRWLCDWVVVMVVLPKLLLRPFTQGIDKPPPNSFLWTYTKWYFIVANPFLLKDKPPLVNGVGRWLYIWVELMAVFPKFLLRLFPLGINKPPPKLFHWTCIQWYFMASNSFLPQDKASFFIGVDRYSYGWLLAPKLFPQFLLRSFTLGIGKPPSKSFYWICIQWYFMVALSLLPQDKASYLFLFLGGVIVDN